MGKIRLGYIKIPNYWETDEKSTLEYNSAELIIEEKLDGKTFDGIDACLSINSDDYLCFFGENLEETHLIRYNNLPNKIILFDIVLILGNGSQIYLPPKYKLLFSLLVGIPHVPIIEVLKNYQREEIRNYMLKRSYFETDLNRKVCEKFPDVCKSFKEKYGEKNFSEGIVVKRYKDGKMKAVKYVKPEFDEIIKIIGRYENYPEKNIITYDLKSAEKLQRQNMEKVVIPFDWRETLLELFRESFTISSRANNIEKIYSNLPEKNRRWIEKLIEKCIRGYNLHFN